jgi:SAM-dependent methyltransferase
VDEQTISAYDAAAAQYARDWLEQPPPDDLHDIVRRYFRGGPTVDIGCGCGREVAWLEAQGYDACGYDASEGLLRQARSLYAGLRFGVAALPQLAGLASAAYANVLCETVVMHLHPDVVGMATRSLLRLLQPSGTLYLSWRVTDDVSMRDKAGRLYAAFEKKKIEAALEQGEMVLLDEEKTSLSSGKKVHRLVIRKPG